jgi:aspartate beta-hydroxylase
MSATTKSAEVEEDVDTDEPLSPSISTGLSSLCLGSSFGAAMAARFVQSTPAAQLPHVLPFLRQLGGEGVPAVSSAYERACPEVIPGLSTPGWIVTPTTDRSALPAALAFIAALESSFPAIRREFLSLRGAGSFQEYRAPSAAASVAAPPAPAGGCSEQQAAALGKEATDSGQWSVCYLQLHNGGLEEGVGGALAACPVTAALLSALPRAYGHAFFSVLQPGSHITRHCGPTNKKVRVHLPLVVPPQPECSRLRVGGRVLPLQEGRCLAFQDSWEHEAWLDAGASSSRATLVVDVWHPALTEAEVRLLKFIRGSELRGSRAASQAGAIPAQQDFYQVLASARAAGVSDEAVFEGCPVVED